MRIPFVGPTIREAMKYSTKDSQIIKKRLSNLYSCILNLFATIKRWHDESVEYSTFISRVLASINFYVYYLFWYWSFVNHFMCWKNHRFSFEFVNRLWQSFWYNWIIILFHQTAGYLINPQFNENEWFLTRNRDLFNLYISWLKIRAKMHHANFNQNQISNSIFKYDSQ